MALLEKSLATADRHRDEKNFVQQSDFLLELLQKDDFKHPEIYWRAARAQLELCNNIEQFKNKDTELNKRALELVKQGLEIDTNNGHCNKWFAIFTDLCARKEGIKARILATYVVKEYLEKARKIIPNEVGTLYCIGVWCYEIAHLSWTKKQLATTFFAKPPSSTYQEAIDVMLEAEGYEPGFYAPNQLYLGKAYLAIGDKENAKVWLSKAVNHPGQGQEQFEAIEEAKQLFVKL